MSQLAELQNSILQTLFNPSRDGSSNATYFVAFKSENGLFNRQKYPIKNQDRGMQAYRANAQMTAIRNLNAAYPVTAQLVGEEAFALLARDMWQQFPPVRGDAAQWGADLAQLISRIAALDEEAYLPDVARIEWALHQAASALDAELDLSSLALLTTQDPDTITLQLAPGTHILTSPLPAASIVMAHIYDSPSFDELRQKLRAPTPEAALVWRQGFRPQVAVCPLAEAAFVVKILKQESLLASLEHAAASQTAPAFDFNAWLQQSAANGLLVGARLMTEKSMPPIG